MRTIYQNPFYKFVYSESDHTLVFEWNTNTENMTDDNFKEALSNYAGYAFELKGPGLIVDVRNFRHNMSEESMQWRNEACLPRYIAAGSSKMAYVMPKPALDNVPGGDVMIGDFTDRYFGSVEEAASWLKQ